MSGRLRSALAPSAVGVCLVLAAAPAASGAVVLDDGHVDYGARMVAGSLQSQVKDGTKAGPPVWREPSDVVFRLGPEAIATIPSGFGFLGPPGTKVWMVPQVQRQGVLWAGWNTEELAPAQISGGVEWRLDAVEGPGRVTVFQTGAFGAVDVLFDSGDGLPDARTIPLGTHAHGNWSFSAPGEYRLTFTMTATRSGGGVTTDTEVLGVRTEGSASGTTPATGGGAGTGGAGGPEANAKKPRLRVAAVRLRGRRLALSARLSRPGRIAVVIRRGGQVLARTPARRIGPRQRRLRFRLGRQLAAGNYRLVASARSGSARTRRVISLRVGSRGRISARWIGTWRPAP